MAAVPAVRHGFTTRESGNLALHRGDSAEVVAENWRGALQMLEPSAELHRLAIVHQVHGADVVEGPVPRGPLVPVGDADALVTTEAGVVLGIRVADCVPVLLSGPGVVGAVHAGWRGAAAGVVGATVGVMTQGVGASELVATVGPSIGGASYEVGDEVVDGLRAAGSALDVFVVGRSARGRALVDVGAAVMDQLRRLGVGRVERVAGCTFERHDLWSHRRDGEAGGRQAALIVRLP